MRFFPLTVAFPLTVVVFRGELLFRVAVVRKVSETGFSLRYLSVVRVRSEVRLGAEVRVEVFREVRVVVADDFLSGVRLFCGEVCLSSLLYADDFRRDECDLDCSAINSPPNCFLSSTGISVDCG